MQFADCPCPVYRHSSIRLCISILDFYQNFHIKLVIKYRRKRDREREKERHGLVKSNEKVEIKKRWYAAERITHAFHIQTVVIWEHRERSFGENDRGCMNRKRERETYLMGCRTTRVIGFVKMTSIIVHRHRHCIRINNLTYIFNV